ncbi:MAG: NAD(P)-dependent alcohol dehydrogenase [Candidatus Lokiarchaeota archaeon]|nr:NAD(P)-dependent alcohol dehydrogenase [Candidatus Lokiarchaeota archaeon]
MKAIVCPKYGPPDVLQLKDIEKPSPNDNEVLIKIQASSLNPADLDFVRGSFYYRMKRLRKPKYLILGSDVAGRVDEIGRNVKQFQAGDEIFVDTWKYGFGAFAEYVCVPEDALRSKPASMTFEQAATLPQAAVLALQGLRDKGRIQSGHKVLINGASGGVGTFAVQIAKSFGAEVTGVASTKKLDMVRSIGADYVIDYTQEDFTKSGQRYDLILDVAAHHSIFNCKRALNPKGIYALIGGSNGPIYQNIFLGPLVSLFGSKKMGIMMWKSNKKESMVSLGELFEAGKFVPVIDRLYPLSEVAEGLRYLEEGHARGKVVITMGQNYGQS